MGSIRRNIRTMRCNSRRCRSKAKYCALVGIAVGLILLVMFIQSEQFHMYKTSYYMLLHSYVFSEEDVSQWLNQKTTECDGNFEAYGQTFALLHNVIMKKDDQKFYLACSGDVKYWFRYSIENHLNAWVENIVKISDTSAYQKLQVANAKTDEKTPLSKLSSKQKLVVAVQRYEWANLYHTMTDWYNIFLVTKLLDTSLKNVSVLLFGEDLNGPLDSIWNTLFDSITYTAEIEEPVHIHHMVWNVVGYESPINYRSRQTLPFVNEFVDFFYQRFGVSRARKLDCERIKIMFLWRRDYMTHPGNKEGKVSRKIKNEDELIVSLEREFPTATVQGVQFDRFSFKEQLEFIAYADIFIGMHGAGLTNVLFLPDHASVLELYPLYKLRLPGNMYFQSMSRWRQLKYQYWQNLNPLNEYPDSYTYIPPSVVINRVKKFYDHMCKK